jgi:hypothetical protein
LIDKKLHDHEVKRFNISVDDYELTTRIEEIASQNNLSLSEFKEVLISKFVGFEEYKEKLKQNMINEKLARNVFSQEHVTVDEEDVQLYYENHVDEFVVPKIIHVQKYAAQDKMVLQQFLKNPLMVSPSIAVEEETIDTTDVNPKLLAMLANTQENRFTPIIPLGNGVFVAMMVLEKKEFSIKPFGSVKHIIMQQLNQESEQKSIENYFQKQRVKAKIITVRVP